jgi:hypothetical protein
LFDILLLFRRSRERSRIDGFHRFFGRHKSAFPPGKGKIDACPTFGFHRILLGDVIHNAPYGLQALRRCHLVSTAQPNLIKVLLYEWPVFTPYSCREARLNLLFGQRVKIGEQ